MSTTANSHASASKQPTQGANAPKSRAKPMRGWRQLKQLLPYVARGKGKVAVGLVALAAMGIVGTLQPLTFGIIIDCLSGNAQPLGRLSRMAPRLIHTLIPAYQPFSGRTLVIYCLVALAIVALKGLFLLLEPLDSDRHVARDRIRPAQRSAGSAAADGAGFYVRNRTGDLMSRATNDLNAVRMVLGPGIMYSATTIATMVLAVFSWPSFRRR